MQQPPNVETHPVHSVEYFDFDLVEARHLRTVVKVDDISHSGHGSQIDLAGYRSCRNQWCPELALKEITERTGGLCTDCFRTHLGEQLAEVEVRARGQRVKARMTGNRRAKNKGNPKTAKLAEKARMKALKRLRAVFPDLYDVFVAEERARLGLDPWSIDAVVRENGGPSADETISFARTYHALDSHGVDIDGLA